MSDAAFMKQLQRSEQLDHELETEQQAHASTKRELEQERGRIESGERTVRRFCRAIERSLGFKVLGEILCHVNGACDNCDGFGEVESSDGLGYLTCGACRGSGQKSPPHPVPPVAAEEDEDAAQHNAWLASLEEEEELGHCPTCGGTYVKEGTGRKATTGDK